MSRWLYYVLIFSLLAVASCSRPSGNTAANWTFDTGVEAGIPEGASVFSGSWVVRAEADAPGSPNALCQIGAADFPAIILSDTLYGDVSIQTLFKPVSGNTDRAAGIIFRVQDKNNYYILRANALENNVNIYKYVNGSRVTLKEGSATVASGKWQVLRVEVTGSKIRGFLDGQLVVEANDATFKSGKIGLWTKADSVTCFDNIEVGNPVN